MRGSQVRFLPGSPKIPDKYAAPSNISFGVALALRRRGYRGATQERGLEPRVRPQRARFFGKEIAPNPQTAYLLSEAREIPRALYSVLGPGAEDLFLVKQASLMATCPWRIVIPPVIP